MKRQVRAERELAATPEAAMALLLDPAGYLNWLPGLSQARLLVREGDIAALELEAPGYAARPVSFELVRTGPLELLFQQTGQLGAGGLSGSVGITGVGDTTRLDVALQIHTPFHRLGAQRRLRDVLEKTLSALAEHLDSQDSATHAAAAERRLILQVRRLEGALEIWCRGKLFTTPLDTGEAPP